MLQKNAKFLEIFIIKAYNSKGDFAIISKRYTYGGTLWLFLTTQKAETTINNWQSR